MLAGVLVILTSCAGTDSNAKAADDALIQDPEKLAAVTIQPKPKRLVPAKYPKEAEEAGIEGEVLVEVFVGKNGNVLKAVVLKESGTHVGFEDAALEAAWKGKWKPAETAKGEKVGVWVAYPISFSLKH